LGGRGGGHNGLVKRVPDGQWQAVGGAAAITGLVLVLVVTVYICVVIFFLEYLNIA
jgi:hypothetical protein